MFHNSIQYFPYHISFISKLPPDIQTNFLATLEKLWKQFLADVLPRYPAPIQNDIKYVLEHDNKNLEEIEKELEEKRVYQSNGKKLSISSILRSIHSCFLKSMISWYHNNLHSLISQSDNLQQDFNTNLPSFNRYFFLSFLFPSHHRSKRAILYSSTIMFLYFFLNFQINNQIQFHFFRYFFSFVSSALFKLTKIIFTS